MDNRQIGGAAAALVLVWSCAAGAVTRTPAHVPVRVYDDVGLQQSALEGVLASAAGALRAALAIDWTYCAKEPHGRPESRPLPVRTPEAAACAAPLMPGELAVRIVSVRLPRDFHGGVALGDAFVDPRNHTGVLATIYYERVQWYARAAGADPAVLLGHTIAHELAHLRAASSHHDVSGLLRPVWTADEVRRNRAEDWQLIGN